MQWMTITFFVPCYVPHVPQHVAVSLFGPLNPILLYRKIMKKCIKSQIVLGNLHVLKKNSSSIKVLSHGVLCPYPETIFMYKIIDIFRD